MLADFLRLLVRRWTLSGVVLLLGLGVAAGVLLVVSPVQRSEAAVLFVPPNRDAQVVGTLNPFLSLGGSMGVVPTVVQTTVTDQRTSDALVAAGHHGVYTVTVDVGENSAPILRVQADAGTVADSQGTAQAVVARIQSQLLALQQSRSVDPQYYISSTVLTSTPVPLVVRTRQIQVSAVAGLAVVVAGFAGVGLLSRARSPWRRRRGASSGVRSASGVDSTLAVVQVAESATAPGSMAVRTPTSTGPPPGAEAGTGGRPASNSSGASTRLGRARPGEPADARSRLLVPRRQVHHGSVGHERLRAGTTTPGRDHRGNRPS